MKHICSICDTAVEGRYFVCEQYGSQFICKRCQIRLLKRDLYERPLAFITMVVVGLFSWWALNKLPDPERIELNSLWDHLKFWLSLGGFLVFGVGTASILGAVVRGGPHSLDSSAAGLRWTPGS